MDNINNINNKPVEGEKSHVSGYAAKPEFTRMEHIAAIFCFLLGFIFVRYLVWNETGFFSTATVLLLVGVCAAYLKASGFELTLRNRMTAVLISVFSLVFSVTDNGAIKSTAEIFILAVGAYWVYAICTRRTKIDEHIDVDIVMALFKIPFSQFFNAPSAAIKSPSHSKSGNFKNVALGLVIAVPITVFVASLLMSADDGVEKLLSGLTENFVSDFGIIFVQIAIGSLVACYLFGMLYGNTHDVKHEYHSEEAYRSIAEKRRFVPNLIAYTALTPALILYAVFFISQSKYFLSAFGGRLPAGFGYAEYARRGFFELFALAAVNMIFILILNCNTISSGEKRTRTLRAYSIMLCGFTLIMIAAALSKMVLYISRFGLTRMRLYTSWTMLLMAVVFVLIIVWQFKQAFPLIRISAAVFVVMFGVLCFSQSDYLIAKYNIAMYENGSHTELDMDYLIHGLSDDSLAYVVERCDGDKIRLPYDLNKNDYIKHRLDMSEESERRFAQYNLSTMVTKMRLQQIYDK
ncbi:MAG: DUF4173 domain-containing protein [Oscillospiraceae bacterium]